MIDSNKLFGDEPVYGIDEARRWVEQQGFTDRVSRQVDVAIAQLVRINPMRNPQDFQTEKVRGKVWEMLAVQCYDNPSLVRAWGGPGTAAAAVSR